MSNMFGKNTTSRIGGNNETTKLNNNSAARISNSNRTTRISNDATVRVGNSDRTTRINNDATVRASDNDKTARINDIDNDRTVRINEGGAKAISIPVGTVIDGYTVLEKCNVSSGQATVHIAEKSKEKFAIKLYYDEEFCISKEVVKKLQYEIDCPYVIKVVASGEYEGMLYTITPFYEEGAVCDHLDEVDSDTLKSVYIEQLNEGLHAIHEAGIYHCDIKPHNFYFSKKRKSLVIGDFGIAVVPDADEAEDELISRKKCDIGGETTSYLAPEGRELAGRSVDYYALGISILVMAHGSDIFEDVDRDVIRETIIKKQVHIPTDVDAEIGKLVEKLTEIDYINHRIGYEGMAKWCKNPGCYGKLTHKDETSYCSIQVRDAFVGGIICNSTEEYVDALYDLWGWGLDYYNDDGILRDLARAENKDNDYIKELSNLKYKYKSIDNEIGFLLTLMDLNPNAKFRFRDIVFGDFKGYIDYIGENYENLSNCFFRKDVILYELENEKFCKKIQEPDRVIEIVKSIFENDKFSKETKMEMLWNYFSGKNAILLNGVMYKGNNIYTGIADLLFDENLEPISNEFVFSQPFLDMLISRIEKFKDGEAELRKIYKTKKTFDRNAKLSIFLTGVVRYSYNGVNLCDLYDFVRYAKDLYENNKNPSHFANLLRTGKVLNLYSQYDNPDADIVAFLKAFKNSTSDDHEILTYFYTNTQKEAIFIHKGKKIADISELFAMLGKSRNIAKDTASLLSSVEFKMWLDGQGYSEVTDTLNKF